MAVVLLVLYVLVSVILTTQQPADSAQSEPEESTEPRFNETREYQALVESRLDAAAASQGSVATSSPVSATTTARLEAEGDSTLYHIPSPQTAERLRQAQLVQ